MAEEFENLAAFFEEQEEEETVVEEETTDESETVEASADEGGEASDDESAEEVVEGDTDTAEASGEAEEAAGHEKGESDTPDPITAEELSTLRQMLREQATEIQTLKAQSQGLGKTLVDQGTIDESDLDSGAEESGGVSDERIQSLSLLAETMKVNPQYADFEEVCSQTNFEMTVEALAKLAQQEDGGSLTEQVQAVTAYIWNLPNPYKFVYDTVKQNHPKYQQTSTETDTETKREAPKPPGGVAKVAGGSGSKNDGWTAAKIDALDEMDLHTVPAAVYEKYLVNELK